MSQELMDFINHTNWVVPGYTHISAIRLFSAVALALANEQKTQSLKLADKFKNLKRFQTMLKKAVYESLSPVWKHGDDKHTNDLELLEDWTNHYSRVVELYRYDMESNTFVIIRQCGVSTDTQPLRLWITDDKYYHTIVNKEKLIDCFMKADLFGFNETLRTAALDEKYKQAYFKRRAKAVELSLKRKADEDALYHSLMEEWFGDFKTFKAQHVPDESLPKGMMSILKDIDLSKKTTSLSVLSKEQRDVEYLKNRHFTNHDLPLMDLMSFHRKHMLYCVECTQMYEQYMDRIKKRCL